MDFDRLMQIQSDLNDFTLTKKNVHLVDAPNPAVTPKAVSVTMKGLREREGEYFRHASALVQMCDRFQWAGNREFGELIDCLSELSCSQSQPENIESLFTNARVEVVDIMHFDLSLLALTCVEGREISELLEKDLLGTLDILKFARSKTDDLQLTKWWTSNKVSIRSIRECALVQFVTLLKYASTVELELVEKPLFESSEDLVATYQSKVEVNYERMRSDYDHVANENMGNSSIK